MTTAPEIVTVTLNAAIDQTASIPNFTAGEVNRVEWEQSDAGGKGVNVASFLADFGHTVAVTGLLGEDNVELFVRLFSEKGLVDRFVRIPGHTRVNVKIVDEARSQVTDINFPGVSARGHDLEAVLAALDGLADQGAQWFILSGSLPAGLPPASYDDLVRRLKARGGRVALDTSGEGLVRAVDAGPDVIKPNIDELAELVGRPLAEEAAIVAAARDLRRRGIDLVAVSMGSRGAILVDGEGAVHAAPPQVPVRSTVGAGDAMVAGLVHGTTFGLRGEALARLATAFSLGALRELGPRLPPREDIEAFRDQVAIRRIATS
jgi:1-phosphofructokinase